jgi:hypothetical protein
MRKIITEKVNVTIEKIKSFGLRLDSDLPLLL